MQYQIRPTCKCDTEECMRAGGEGKISFLIPKTSQAQGFSVNSETLSSLQQNTYIIFQLHMLVLSKYRVGGFFVADNFISYKSEPAQVLQRH